MVQKRACDACHKRKLTPCNWCEHHGLACTFNRERGRKKTSKLRSKQTTENNLSKRLKRIEDALSETLARQTSVDLKPLTPGSEAADARRSSDGSGEQSAQEPSRASTSKASSSFFRDPASVFESPLTSHDSPFTFPVSSPASSFAGAASSGQIHYGGCHFGRLSQHNGMPILSEAGRQWIMAKTGQESVLESCSKSSSGSRQSPAYRYYNSPTDLYECPDRATVEKVFNAFVHSIFRFVFPVLDWRLFQETIALAYQPIPGESISLHHLSAKACVLAFTSLISFFQDTLEDVCYIEPDVCATKARYLLTDVLENPSVTSLQVVLMLELHDIVSGRLRSASMLHAIACRMIFTLGGHTYISLKPSQSPLTRSERERGQLRMLFWLAYVFDKDIALRTGQPPLMSDDYCDLTLPDNYASWYSHHRDANGNPSLPSVNDEDLMFYLPMDPLLSRIKDKASRLLFSVQAANKSHAQLLRDIREVDEELEAWRMSIPPDFRPALSISDESQVILAGLKPPVSMEQINLHLEYHHLMSTIHRVSGRCMDLESAHLDKSDRMPGIESSIDLALEASRSTIIFLRAAISGIAGQAFWFVAFYPTAAMMTLFLNILMNPLNDRAEDDIQLLQSAAHLVNSFPVSRFTPHEIAYMKMVDDFAAELVRLGRCAIAKAKTSVQKVGCLFPLVPSITTPISPANLSPATSLASAQNLSLFIPKATAPLPTLMVRGYPIESLVEAIEMTNFNVVVPEGLPPADDPVIITQVYQSDVYAKEREPGVEITSPFHLAANEIDTLLYHLEDYDCSNPSTIVANSPVTHGDLQHWLKCIFHKWDSTKPLTPKPVLRPHGLFDTSAMAGTFKYDLPPIPGEEGVRPERQQHAAAFLGIKLNEDRTVSMQWKDIRGGLANEGDVQLFSYLNIHTAHKMAITNYDSMEKARVLQYNWKLAIYAARKQILGFVKAGIQKGPRPKPEREPNVKLHLARHHIEEMLRFYHLAIQGTSTSPRRGLSSS
ncbi:hypothetical protein F66182_7855 [Fusarium sp. NRRL 66182]|nr:hypothetical protein F66182_7855 [Fusarium sp. NRRL 66182]